MAKRKNVNQVETPEEKIKPVEVSEDLSTTKIKFLKTAIGKYGVFYKDGKYDVSTSLAKLFIQNKEAEEIK